MIFTKRIISQIFKDYKIPDSEHMYSLFSAIFCGHAAKNSGFGVPLSFRPRRFTPWPLSPSAVDTPPPIPYAQEGFRPPNNLSSLNEGRVGGG
jgi:hypothetical protein